MRARRLLGLVAAASLLLVFSGCAAPTAAPAPAATGPVVSFYGDSYTRGTGASANDKRWSTIVSAERGWQEINRSENGLGFVNRRASMGPGLDDIPAQVIADDPDLVFVTMGLNDNFSYDRAADRIRETIDSDLERLRAACPTPHRRRRALLVHRGPPGVGRRHRGWVEDAAARIGADHIAGASHWLDGHYADSSDSWMAADGLHPNDTGYAYMAERMDAALRALDPPL